MVTDRVYGHVDARVWNDTMSQWIPLEGFIRLAWSDEMTLSPSEGEVVVPGSHPLASRLWESLTDVVPVTIQVNGVVWSGRVVEPVESGRPGATTLSAKLASDKKHAKRLIARPAPRKPIEFQAKQDFQNGRLRTVSFHYIRENVSRTGLPVYLVKPFGEDTTAKVSVYARMHTLEELLVDLVERHNLNPTIRMWWPGQPVPTGVIELLAGPEEKIMLADVASTGAFGRLEPTVTDASGSVILTRTMDETYWRPADAKTIPAAEVDATFYDHRGVKYASKEDAAARLGAGPHISWVDDLGQKRAASETQLTNLAAEYNFDIYGRRLDVWDKATWMVFVRGKKVNRLWDLKGNPTFNELFSPASEKQMWRRVFEDDWAGPLLGITTGGKRYRGFPAELAAITASVNTEVLEPLSVPGLMIQFDGLRERKDVVWSTQPGGGLEEFTRSGRHPEASSLTAGGKTDDWIMELINLGQQIVVDAVTAGVSGAMTAAGGLLAGPAGAVVGAVVGTALSWIFSAVNEQHIDGSLLAFREWDQPDVLEQQGPWYFREVFVDSGAGAYTLDTTVLMEQEWFKNQGQQQVEMSVADGAGLILGDDRVVDGTRLRGWRVGDVVRFEDRGTTVTDVMSGYSAVVEEGKALRVTPRVGAQRKVIGSVEQLVDHISESDRRLKMVSLSK